MKKIKRLFVVILTVITLLPSSVLAYSNRVILGGDNIGIKVNTKYVMIVGFYKVNNAFIAEDAGLKIGDNIIKINEVKVNTIDEMIDVINSNNNDNIDITILRNNKEETYKLKLIEDDNGIYKTGLYVKDTINGIGSLTYIDPETNIYGALGHEISSKYTSKKADINDGDIFKSEIVGITKSTKGVAGAKEAKLYSNDKLGNIIHNTNKGIFGKYNELKNKNNYIDIVKPEDIKLGKAYIRTVLNGNEVKNYEIEIINIDWYSETKNILFKILDKELLEKTGGVVAGMSGSPIIQNDKLIGAVTHVVVNDPSKGFGIFITTMLEEGEKE